MGMKTIIYIAGDGHSGSTLLDIILGSQKKAFSAGELRFLAEKGVKNGEYCSCSVPVPECPLWSQIIEKWEKVRVLDLDEYIQIQKKLKSNKKILAARKLLNKKPKQIKNFLDDTEKLYRIIFSVSKSDYIIDSSKAPGMIPILKELNVDLNIVHLKRRFGDVLNSNKKSAKKDLKKGIEHDIEPRNTLRVLVNWLFVNALTKIYSKDTKYKRVKYETYIDDLKETISDIVSTDSDYEALLVNRGPFYPEHLVAGNIIRLKNDLYVAKNPMNTSYSRLNNRDKLIARTIDSFY